MVDPIAAPKILAVDSSTLSGSLALCEGERLIGEIYLSTAATHSELLLRQLDHLLAEAGWHLEQLDLLAAVCGPGSFTGLRIGVATVKGLAEVLKKPVVGISSLQLLAMNLPLCPWPICAFLDARKKEVYSQLFHWTDQGAQPLGEPRVLPPEELLQQLEGEVALVGDGVPLYRDLIDKILAGRVCIPAVQSHLPRASQAAWLACQRFRAGDLEEPAELVPRYVRPSDAELNQQGR